MDFQIFIVAAPEIFLEESFWFWYVTQDAYRFPNDNEIFYESLNLL